MVVPYRLGLTFRKKCVFPTVLTGGEQMTFEDIFSDFSYLFGCLFDVRHLEGSQLGRGVFTGASFENMSF